MGLLDELAREIVFDFTGLKESIVDELSGDADEILLRRFRNEYDNLPTEAVDAIRDNLGHERGEKTPCKICKIIADKEFELANEEFE